LEGGQAPASAHSCVGRIRYMGVLLYDADLIPEAAMVHDADLVEAQRNTILDPFDPAVLQAARDNGIEESWLGAAQRSPVYQFVKQWRLALPLRPEYRTMAMMYYVPPLSPVIGAVDEDRVRLDLTAEHRGFELFARLDSARLPVQYLAHLFAGGNEGHVRSALRKLLAVRTYMRRKTVEGAVDADLLALLAEAGTSPDEVEAIYRLTTLSTLPDRFVIPQYHREMAVEAWKDPLAHKGEAGFGYVQAPVRGE
jgi:nitrate reductase / nitrite oxidoreductase, beta subunit